MSCILAGKQALQCNTRISSPISFAPMVKSRRMCLHLARLPLRPSQMSVVWAQSGKKEPSVRAPSSKNKGVGLKKRDEKSEKKSPQRDESDIFIDEVSEELQRERLNHLARTYGPYALGALVALVVGIFAYEINRSIQTEAAYEAGASIVAAQDSDKPAERLAAIAGDLDTAGVIANMRAAVLYTDGQGGDDSIEKAVELYKRVIAADVDPAYQDMARLRTALLTTETSKTSDLVSLIQPATLPGRPYRPAALEILAAAYLDGGDVDAARQALISARDDASSSDSAKSRVADLLAALDEFGADAAKPPKTTNDAGDSEKKEDGAEQPKNDG